MKYTVIVLVVLIFSYRAEKKNNRKFAFLAALTLSMLSGLRSVTVGVDTQNYYNYINNVKYSGYSFGSDIGFSFVCDLLLKIFSEPAYLLLIFAIIINFLIVYRCWDFSDKSSFTVMMAVYIVLQFPYSMNVVRQFLAIAIIFFASRYIEKGKSIIYVILTIIAATIHTSALMGFVYLFAYKSTIEKNKKQLRRYALIIISMIAFFILMNELGIVRYFINYSENSLTYSFSLLTMYRLLCVLLVVAVTRFFKATSFSMTQSGEIVPLDKSVSIICLAGLALCTIGMFVTYMNRIGFYFMAFEMPFWGQACRMVNKSNRRVFKILLFAMLIYVYASAMSSNDIAGYMTFFAD